MPLLERLALVSVAFDKSCGEDYVCVSHRVLLPPLLTDIAADIRMGYQEVTPLLSATCRGVLYIHL
jgi:hypothetical protein